MKLNEFIWRGSDTELMKSLYQSYLDSDIEPPEELTKALDKAGLVQVQRTVNSKHGQYTRMQWVRPSDVKDTDKVVGQSKEEDDTPKDKNPSQDAQPSQDTSKLDSKKSLIDMLMSGSSREDVMAEAENQGVKWEKSEHEGINWLRCSNAIQNAGASQSKPNQSGLVSDEELKDLMRGVYDNDRSALWEITGRLREELDNMSPDTYDYTRVKAYDDHVSFAGGIKEHLNKDIALLYAESIKKEREKEEKSHVFRRTYAKEVHEMTLDTYDYKKVAAYQKKYDYEWNTVDVVNGMVQLKFSIDSDKKEGLDTTELEDTLDDIIKSKKIMESKMPMAGTPQSIRFPVMREETGAILKLIEQIQHNGTKGQYPTEFNEEDVNKVNEQLKLYCDRYGITANGGSMYVDSKKGQLFIKKSTGSKVRALKPGYGVKWDNWSKEALPCFIWSRGRAVTKQELNEVSKEVYGVDYNSLRTTLTYNEDEYYKKYGMQLEEPSKKDFFKPIR